MNHFMQLLFAAAFAAAGVWSLIQYIRDRRRNFVSVTGRVVDMESKRSSKGHTTYAPVYEYYHRGHVYRRTHNVTSSVRIGWQSMPTTKYPIGSEIPLLVDQDEPSYALVDDISKYLSLFCGFLFLGCGVYCILSTLGIVF